MRVSALSLPITYRTVSRVLDQDITGPSDPSPNAIMTVVSARARSCAVSQATAVGANSTANVSMAASGPSFNDELKIPIQTDAGLPVCWSGDGLAGELAFTRAPGTRSRT